jgi:hypothetical protein
MPYLLGIYIQSKLLAIYVYKNMKVLENHSNNLIGYSVPRKYTEFFKIMKITNMDFNKYKYVSNNLGEIINF